MLWFMMLLKFILASSYPYSPHLTKMRGKRILNPRQIYSNQNMLLRNRNAVSTSRRFRQAPLRGHNTTEVNQLPYNQELVSHATTNEKPMQELPQVLGHHRNTSNDLTSRTNFHSHSVINAKSAAGLLQPATSFNSSEHSQARNASDFTHTNNLPTKSRDIFNRTHNPDVLIPHDTPLKQEDYISAEKRNRVLPDSTWIRNNPRNIPVDDFPDPTPPEQFIPRTNEAFYLHRGPNAPSAEQHSNQKENYFGRPQAVRTSHDEEQPYQTQFRHLASNPQTDDDKSHLNNAVIRTQLSQENERQNTFQGGSLYNQNLQYLKNQEFRFNSERTNSYDPSGFNRGSSSLGGHSSNSRQIFNNNPTFPGTLKTRQSTERRPDSKAGQSFFKTSLLQNPLSSNQQRFFHDANQKKEIMKSETSEQTNNVSEDDNSIKQTNNHATDGIRAQGSMHYTNPGQQPSGYQYLGQLPVNQHPANQQSDHYKANFYGQQRIRQQPLFYSDYGGHRYVSSNSYQPGQVNPGNTKQDGLRLQRPANFIPTSSQNNNEDIQDEIQNHDQIIVPPVPAGTQFQGTV